MSVLYSDPAEPLFWQDESPEDNPNQTYQEAFYEMYVNVGKAFREVAENMEKAITHSFTPSRGVGKTHFTVEQTGRVLAHADLGLSGSPYIVYMSPQYKKELMKYERYREAIEKGNIVFYGDLGGTNWSGGIVTPDDEVTGSTGAFGGQSHRRGGLQQCPRHGSTMAGGFCRQCSRGR